MDSGKRFDWDPRKAIRNPFYKDFVIKKEISIVREDYDVFERVAAEKGVSTEDIILRCLSDSARMLQEFETEETLRQKSGGYNYSVHEPLAKYNAAKPEDSKG